MNKPFHSLTQLIILVFLGVFNTSLYSQINELPVVDGNGSDAIWATANTFPIETIIIDHSIADENDFSGTAKVIWSADTLYYLIEVKDDILYTESENHWENDNFVLYLDLNNQKTASYTDNTQMFFEIYWYDRSHAGRVGTSWTPNPAHIAKNLIEGTSYTAEVAISFADIGWNASADDTLGFEVKINDNDGDAASPAAGRNILSLHDETDLSYAQPWVFSSIVLNGNGSVSRVEYPLVLDGSMDGSLAYIKQDEAISSRISSINNYRGFSGSFRANWTSENINIYLNVTDEKLYSGSPDHFENDNFGIYLDLNNQKTNSYFDTTQMFWEIYWYDRAPAGRVGSVWTPNPIEYAIDVNEAEELFQAEIVISWGDLGFTPAIGDTLGFDFKINDNDGEGRSILSWHDNTDSTWTDPGKFGNIVLDKNNNILWLDEPIDPFVCDSKDSLMIAVMGSSVANGTGATNNQGYAYQYAELLDERADAGEGASWYMENISVGGNTTIHLLDRWDSDLLPLCSRYVVYGLSLGNEGIHEKGQPMFDQFRDNMLLLIDNAREEGIEPVVVNNYTRSDYNATDYDFIKQMNLLIHSWDVASINVLGAIDNGAGRWAAGHFADGWHPNTMGHKEFYHAFVPSLFDALHEGKPQPSKVEDTYLTIDKSTENYQLEFTPDGVVHPFTFSFDIKTSSSGIIGGFETESGYGLLTIDPGSGNLNYFSNASDGIQGVSAIDDEQWHKVTVTHYYAWGKSFLYIDNELQGSVNEKLVSNKFFISSISAPKADYREWYFYRSAMNTDEIVAMVNDSLLKSSLELYAPLDGQGVTGSDELVNLAQSMNAVEMVDAYELPSIIQSQVNQLNSFHIYPNPSKSYTNLNFSLSSQAFVNLAIMDITGRKIETLVSERLQSGNYTIKWEGRNKNNNLSSNVFFCYLEIDGIKYFDRIVIVN